MSFVLLGILNSQAAGGGIYRLQTLGGADIDIARSIHIDPNNNVYVAGETNSTGMGNYDILFAKYDSSGSIQWQRTLGSNELEYGLDIATDQNDNVYVSGMTAANGPRDALIAKYNSSGTIQWQKTLGGAESDDFDSIDFDSTDNIYALGTTRSDGNTAFLFAKYDSSGSIQWQRVLFSNSSPQFGSDLAVDSSNNIYCVGEGDMFTSRDAIIAKYNSSGTIQWQRFFGSNSASFDSDDFKNVAVDSAGDIVVVGRTRSDNNDALIAKYNSSGTIQWQRALGFNDGNWQQGYSVALDSADNIYLGGRDGTIAKYNSSGTIQWQRNLSNVDDIDSIAVDGNDNIYATAYTTAGAGGLDLLIAVLPNDGSLTGTYLLAGENFVYSATTLTSGTPTKPSAPGTLNSLTSPLTAATSTLTSASASLTEHRVNL